MDLFSKAQEYLHRYVRELVPFGVQTDSHLELKRRPGMLCTYNPEDKHIYLCFPESTDPLDKLQRLMMRSLLSCENDEELTEMIHLCLPRLIAHELGHYYRDFYGLLSRDLWHEEQIANLLANALTKRFYTTDEKKKGIQYIKRAISGLAEKMKSKHVAADSYHNPLQALNSSGALQTDAMEKIQMMSKMFYVDSNEILKESGQLSQKSLNRLKKRENVIEEFNEQYSSNVMKYFYYQLGWMLLDLESRENSYVEEFVRLYLNRPIPLLPIIDVKPNPSEEEIVACFKAQQKMTSISEIGSRYFYKRYRSLLLAKILSEESDGWVSQSLIRREATNLLETWDEEELDSLEILMPVVPDYFQFLFPNKIGKYLNTIKTVDDHLKNATDLWIWRHLARKKTDECSTNTIHRLALLEKSDIFSSLPAEILIKLLHHLWHVCLGAGETIIWEGDNNQDVFILIKGQLKVVDSQRLKSKRSTIVQVGETIGEMNFFTKKLRNTTVTATKPSECFVVKASDLQLFAFEHPVIFMKMGRLLAKRLESS